MGKRITKKDLKDFVKALEMEGFEHNIPLAELDAAIMERFGMSPQTVRNYKKLLVYYGFLKPSGVGVFDVDSLGPLHEKDLKKKKPKTTEKEDDGTIN